VVPVPVIIVGVHQEARMVVFETVSDRACPKKGIYPQVQAASSDGRRWEPNRRHHGETDAITDWPERAALTKQIALSGLNRST
jgi:hypothetical protein